MGHGAGYEQRPKHSSDSNVDSNYNWNWVAASCSTPSDKLIQIHMFYSQGQQHIFERVGVTVAVVWTDRQKFLNFDL